MEEIKVGSIDWNCLEEMIERLGKSAVVDAVERICPDDDIETPIFPHRN